MAKKKPTALTSGKPTAIPGGFEKYKSWLLNGPFKNSPNVDFVNDLRTLMRMSNAIIGGLGVLASYYERYNFKGRIYMVTHQENFMTIRNYFLRFHGMEAINITFESSMYVYFDKYNIVDHYIYDFEPDIEITIVLIRNGAQLEACMKDSVFSVEQIWIDHENYYVNYPEHFERKIFMLNEFDKSDKELQISKLIVLKEWGLRFACVSDDYD